MDRSKSVVTPERFAKGMGMALQQSPFFKIWACAGVDEMITALHERLTNMGGLAAGPPSPPDARRVPGNP